MSSNKSSGSGDTTRLTTIYITHDGDHFFGLNTSIEDFDQSLSESQSVQELVDRIIVLDNGFGNPYTLWIRIFRTTYPGKEE